LGEVPRISLLGASLDYRSVCEAGTGDVAYAGHGDRVSSECEKVIPYSKNAEIHRF
jgi:hypothetical protein